MIKTPTPPDQDCNNVETAVWDDCDNALSILRSCGVIDNGDYSLGSFTCNMASDQAKRDCEQAKQNGGTYVPPRMNQSARARIFMRRAYESSKDKLNGTGQTQNI